MEVGLQNLLESWLTPPKEETQKPMNTPGITIPTPITKTPMGATTSNHQQPLNDTHTNIEDFDDSAFLPDDFQPNTAQQEKENAKFTAKQVQDRIEEALRHAELQWNSTFRKQLQHESQKLTDNLRREGESSLEDHANSWEEDHQQEIDRIKKEMQKQQDQQRIEFQSRLQQTQDKHDSLFTALRAKVDQMEQQIERQSKEMEELKKIHDQEMQQEKEIRCQLEAAHQAELESLKQNVKTQRQDGEKAVLELNEQHTRELNERLEEQQLSARMELEATITQHQTELDMLKAEIDKMRQSGEETIASLTVSHSRDMESQQKQQQDVSRVELEQLGAKYERQMTCLEQDSERKLHALREELTLKFEGEVTALQSEKNTEHQKKVEELEMEMVALFDQLETIEKEAKHEKAASLQRIEEIEKLHLAQIEELQKFFDVERTEWAERGRLAQENSHDLSRQVTALTEQIAKLEHETQEIDNMKKWWEDKLCKERSAFAKAEEEMVAAHKQELQKLNEDFRQQMEKERQSFETKLKDMMANQTKHTDREMELLERLSILEETSKKQAEKFDLRVKLVREEHASQIDEMLAELDKVELEHNQRNKELQMSFEQKDAIISALGTQLADANNKRTELQQEHEIQMQKLKATEAQLEVFKEEVDELEAALERNAADSSLALEEEKKKGKALCDQVRKETIAAAEQQFNKANEHYMALKYEYDNATAKITKLEKEVRSLKREVESVRSEGASREAEVAAQLAQARAELANAEATAARKIKDVQTKIDLLKALNRETQTKLEDSNAGRNAANMSLTVLVSEKAALVKEVADLKAVCEDMMKMIEEGELVN